MWSLTLPRTKRISGPKTFRTVQPKKTFSTLSANFGIGSVVAARKEVERGRCRAANQRPVERTAQTAVLTKPLPKT
jgi:hypothetical protein